jgi:hypothetical protein
MLQTDYKGLRKKTGTPGPPMSLAYNAPTDSQAKPFMRPEGLGAAMQ